MSEYTLGLQSQPPPAENPIDCGGWWPAINVLPFYDDYRIPAVIPQNQIREYLKVAIIRCMRDVASWYDDMVEAGYTSLDEVTGAVVDGENERLTLWRRAVYCNAKAEILKESQLVDRRKERGVNDDDILTIDETEHKYRELAAVAIRMMTDQTDTQVELL